MQARSLGDNAPSYLCAGEANEKRSMRKPKYNLAWFREPERAGVGSTFIRVSTGYS